MVETAVALLEQGVDARLVTGWVPSDSSAWLARLAGRIIGRPNLDKRLRATGGNGELSRDRLRCCALAEGFAQGLLKLGDAGLLPYGYANRVGWQAFGLATRRYLHGADVFHVRSGAGQGGAIAAARRRGMKIVVDHSIAHPREMELVLKPLHEQLGIPFRLSTDSPFWKLVLQDCHDADVVLVNSDYVKRTFVEAGFPAAKIEVAYWGVRDDFLGLKQDYSCSGPVRLLFTGAFGLRKGAREIVGACRQLDHQGLEYELRIAGVADEGRPLVEQARLKGTVKFYGMLLQDDLKELLATSDLYVFPTYAEGCARSAMEAMGAGLPVITTAACGLPVRHGVDGWIVPRADGRAVAGVIEHLLRDAEGRESIGRTAQARVAAEFRWANFAQRLVELYGRLLGSAA
jgi:glycosyltransferase involved in cell wall biosynthesis